MTRSVEIPGEAVGAAAQVFFDLAHPEANVSGLTLASFPGSVDRYHRYTRAALVAARQYLMPTREALGELVGQAWDDGNAMGLDGYVGPNRGAGNVDPEAERGRERMIDRVLALLNGES